ILIAASLLLNTYLPINKRLWTTTFALLSSGVALVLFAFIYIITDVKKWQKWCGLFLLFGSNALLAFIISNLIIPIFDIITIHQGQTKLSLHAWGNQLCL